MRPGRALGGLQVVDEDAVLRQHGQHVLRGLQHLRETVVAECRLSARKPSASRSSRGKSSARTRVGQSGRRRSRPRAAAAAWCRAARPAWARPPGRRGAARVTDCLPGRRRLWGARRVQPCQQGLQRGAELDPAGRQQLGQRRGGDLRLAAGRRSISRLISRARPGRGARAWRGWRRSRRSTAESVRPTRRRPRAGAQVPQRARRRADQHQRQHEGDQKEQPVDEDGAATPPRSRRRSRWRSW